MLRSFFCIHSNNPAPSNLHWYHSIEQENEVHNHPFLISLHNSNLAYSVHGYATLISARYYTSGVYLGGVSKSLLKLLL